MLCFYITSVTAFPSCAPTARTIPQAQMRALRPLTAFCLVDADGNIADLIGRGSCAYLYS